MELQQSQIEADTSKTQFVLTGIDGIKNEETREKALKLMENIKTNKSYIEIAADTSIKCILEYIESENLKGNLIEEIVFVFRSSPEEISTKAQEIALTMRKLNIKTKFKYLQQCGEGGMSKVYRASAIRFSQDPNEILEADTVFKLTLNNESFANTIDFTTKQKLNGIKVPNMVEIKGLGYVVNLTRVRIKEILFFEEEHYEEIEGTLEDFICEMDALEASKLVLEAVQGIQEGLHSQNIIHRDIKPANIFIIKDASGKRTAKIADTGIACEAGRKDKKEYLVGTPLYALLKEDDNIYSYENDLVAISRIILGILMPELFDKFKTGSSLGILGAMNFQLAPYLRNNIKEISQKYGFREEFISLLASGCSGESITKEKFDEYIAKFNDEIKQIEIRQELQANVEMIPMKEASNNKETIKSAEQIPFGELIREHQKRSNSGLGGFIKNMFHSLKGMQAQAA